MPNTTATISDVAKAPGGNAIPFAIIVSYPRNEWKLSGSTEAKAHSAIANAAGVFALSGLESTDAASNSTLDTFMDSLPFTAYGTDHYGSHHVMVIDPRSGEHVFDADVVIPTASAGTQQTPNRLTTSDGSTTWSLAQYVV